MSKQIIYDASTGEEIIQEIEDSEVETADNAVDTRQAAYEAINAATTIKDLKSAMLNFIDASGIK